MAESPDHHWERYWSALVDQSDEAMELRQHAGPECGLLEDLNDVRLLLEQDLSILGDVVPPPISSGLGAEGFQPGDDIDGYVIERRIGQGGMGAVYAAYQRALDRRVALKFIRSGTLATEEDDARFRSEASAAARLNHSGIVAVYDFGRSQGFQYLSMELVEGVSLADRLREGPLEADATARMAIELCEAIDHAHGHGVVHRDIKPSNVLLDANNDRLRVADFGLAKCLGDDTREDWTLSGTMVGTPSYMSPEQALGLNRQVGPLSDVYSIGTVLYEMLTGRPPFQAASPVETLRQVTDNEPASPRTMNSEISVDLETVCLKCLAKSPAQRYSSAQAVADDLRRVLEGRPIQARRAGTWQRFRKWVGRNRALAAALGLFAVSLILGTITSTLMWRTSAQHALRAEQRLVAEKAAKQEAQRQARIAEAVTAFFTSDVLRQADPHTSPDRDVSLVEVLDAAAQRLEEQFADEPLVAAEIHQALGDTYLGIGRTDQCETHLRKALELFREELGPEDPVSLRSATRIGMYYYSTGQYASAESTYRGIVDALDRQLGQRDAQTLHSRGQLAHALYWLRKYDEAETIFVDVMRKEASFGEDHLPALLTLNNLAILYCATERYEEAIDLLLEALRRQERLLGDEHPHTLTTLNNLGYAHACLKRHEQALKYYTVALEGRQRILGDHLDTAYSLHNLGLFHETQGDLVSALDLYHQAHAMRMKVLGPDHPDTHISVRQLAHAFAAIGNDEAAARWCRRAWEIDQHLAEEDPRRGRTEQLLRSLQPEELDHP